MQKSVLAAIAKLHGPEVLWCNTVLYMFAADTQGYIQLGSLQS
jgi:hypothetical protein